MIRTITEKARALIHGACLEKTFWGEAVLTATFLINISPSRALKPKKTPWELWHNKKPQLKYIKIFGATVFVHEKLRKTKFQAKAWKGILVGFDANGYKVWDMATGNFVIARDVTVDEKSYLQSRPKDLQSKRVQLENSSGEPTVSENMVQDHIDNNISIGESRREICEIEDESEISEGSYQNENNDNNSFQENIESDTNHIELRRSERLKNIKPVSYNEIDSCIMFANIDLDDIPRSYNEIKSRTDSVEWEKAVKEELASHEYNNTWTIISKPKDINIIDCKWIFTIKSDEFGNAIRRKARLVARGFMQQYMVDFGETFAPVARISSFRLIIAFANQFNLHVHYMDVKTALLNGILKENIYMKIPEGVVGDGASVCKLNKSIYGLKQAARSWFEAFDYVLKENGFMNSAVDRCIYIKNNNSIEKNIYLVLYVDDIVIATASSQTMKVFKKFLMQEFKMTDMNEIKHFLSRK